MRPPPSAAIPSATAAVSRRGSMRIAGASTTSAPSSASRVARPLACARARVITTLRPKSWARSNQASRSRSAATGPTTVSAGGRMPSASARSAISSSVALTTRCPGSVPRSITAAGSEAGRPCSIRRADTPWKRAHSHVEDERPREGGERLPVEGALGLGRVLVGGHEGDRRSLVAVGDRDARVCRCGDAGGDARHDLERNARIRERPRPPRRPARTRTGRRPSGAPPACRRVHARRAARRSHPARCPGRRVACRRRSARRPAARGAAARAGSGDRGRPRRPARSAQAPARSRAPGRRDRHRPGGRSPVRSRSRAYGKVEARRRSSAAPALSIRSASSSPTAAAVAGLALDAVGDPLAAVGQPGIRERTQRPVRRSREDAPTGVWQLASSRPTTARSQSRRLCDGSWSSGATAAAARSSPARTSSASMPWPGAGTKS